MKKIIKLLLVLMIVAIIVTVLATSSQAISNTSSDLHLKEDIPLLLRCDELDVSTKHVYHTYNGKEYPAYCLNEYLQGVTSENEYKVTIDGEISDIGLWRVIVNGYPYKTIEELGCKSEQEAYTATQHAIYCYLSNRYMSQYTPAREQEGGIRTYEALKNILTNAQNSTETPTENNKVFNGKAPQDGLQNYALTGIVEEKEEMKQEPKVEVEEIKLPKTGM